jgi:Glycosyl transferase family 2
MIPYFLAHYRGLVDRIFVFDNGSTDASLRLLGADSLVTVTHFDVTGDSFVAEELRMYNTMWRASRGQADWIIVVDMDEHLHHANLKGYLRNCANQGITVIPTIGYDMIGDGFPSSEEALWLHVTAGCRHPAKDFDKLSIFDPNAISDINYTAGGHDANPVGRVVYPAKPEVKLLHYKRLGLAYLQARWAELRTGLRPGDIANRWGVHYLTPPEGVESDYNWHQRLARTVPGLDGARNADVNKLDLHLELDGARIDPLEVRGTKHVFDIPGQAATLWIVSEPLNGKHRRLGAPISQIVLRGASGEYELTLDDEWAVGWWRPVKMVDGVVHWTDGRGLLRLPELGWEPSVLEIDIAEKWIRAWA